MIESRVRAAPVHRAQVNRQRVTRRRRARLAADLVYIGRPCDRKRLRAPYCLKKGLVRTLGKAPHDAGRVREAHLVGINRRILRLFGGGILEVSAGGSQIKEVPAIEITLRLIVLEGREIGGIGVTLRLAMPVSRNCWIC